MSYLALYRKYRPDSFEELVGQNFVIDILKNSIKNGKISHAYLFSGPRGTGKTSTAKLLAKLINCKESDGINPCNKCESCSLINDKNNPDIIEMDAASNNGVDEIREIRDKVSLMPSVSKYKVYIIDEVHMLSTGAFNALLKTLEEPPSHVIFILATTEFYKVPETIVSRCQCFEFSRISVEDIVKRLNFIVQKENITVEPEVLNLIAKYSVGGMRDAIGFLDKLSCYSENITTNDFYCLRGIVIKEDLREFINLIYENNLEKVMNMYDNFVNKGKNILILMDDLLDCMKNLIIENLKEKSEKYDIDILFKYIDILDDYGLKIKNFSNPKILFEVCLLKMLNTNNSGENISREIIFEKKCIEKTKNGTNETKKCEIMSNIVKNNENISENITDYIERQHIIINNAFATANKGLLEDIKIMWINLSDYLHNKEFCNIVSYLLDGNLRVAGEKDVIISVRYDSLVNNALLCIDKIKLLFDIAIGRHCNIAFVTDDDWDRLKDEFISNKKRGIIYKYIEEKEKNDGIIVSDESLNVESQSVNDAIDLFGDDLVVIK